jgi:hypothetical protein
MNYKRAVAVLVVAASCLYALPANSAKRHHHPRPARPQPYIACTMLGCAPVPPGCVPIEGRTPGGMPTGFDVVACPPGVAPFR